MKYRNVVPWGLVLGGVVAATLALPTNARAQEPMAQEPTPYTSDMPQTERYRPNRPLLIASGSAFLGAYATSAVIGAVNDRDEDKFLLVPLVGPWIDLGNRDCAKLACDNEDWSKALLIGSGVIQTLGAAGTIASFFVTETRTTTARATEKSRWMITPSNVGRTGYGLSAAGTF